MPSGVVVADSRVAPVSVLNLFCITAGFVKALQLVVHSFASCGRDLLRGLVGLQLDHVGGRQFLRAQHAVIPIQRRDNSTVNVPLDNDINSAVAVPFGGNDYTVAGLEVLRGIVSASVGFVCVHNAKVAWPLIESTSLSRLLKDFLGAHNQWFTGLFTEERGGESE
jgi:hypothetical protein